MLTSGNANSLIGVDSRGFGADMQIRFNLEKFVSDQNRIYSMKNSRFNWNTFKRGDKFVNVTSKIFSCTDLAKLLTIPRSFGSLNHGTQFNLINELLNYIKKTLDLHRFKLIELYRTTYSLQQERQKSNQMSTEIQKLKKEVEYYKNQENVIRKSEISYKNPEVRVLYVNSLREGLTRHFDEVYKYVILRQGFEDALSVYSKRVLNSLDSDLYHHFQLLHQKSTNNTFINDKEGDSDQEKPKDVEVPDHVRILARIETLAKDLNEKHCLPQYSMGFLAKYEGLSQTLLKYFAIWGAVTTKSSLNRRFSLERMKPSYLYGLSAIYKSIYDLMECWDNFNCDELGNACQDGFVEQFKSLISFALRRSNVENPIFELTWENGLYRKIFLSQENSSGSSLRVLEEEKLGLETYCSASYPDVCRSEETKSFYDHMNMTKKETQSSLSQCDDYPLPLEPGKSSSIYDFLKLLLAYHFFYRHFNPAKACRSLRIFCGDGEYMNHIGCLIGAYLLEKNMSMIDKRNLGLNNIRIDWTFLFTRLPWGGVWHIQKNSAIGITPMRYSVESESTHSMGFIKFVDDLMYRIRFEVTRTSLDKEDGDIRWNHIAKLGREYDIVMKKLFGLRKVWLENYEELVDILSSVDLPDAFDGHANHPDFFEKGEFWECTYLPHCEVDMFYGFMDFVLPTIVDFKNKMSMDPKLHPEFVVGGRTGRDGSETRGRGLYDDEEEEEYDEYEEDDGDELDTQEGREGIAGQVNYYEYKLFVQKTLMNMYVVCVINNHTNQRHTLAWMLFMINALKGDDLNRFLDYVCKIFEVKVEFIHGDREISIMRRCFKGTMKEKQWLNYAAPGAEKNREYRSRMYLTNRSCRYKDVDVPQKLYDAILRALRWFCNEMRERMLRNKELNCYPFMTGDYITIPYGNVTSNSVFEYYQVKKSLRFPSSDATDENLRSDFESFIKIDPSKEQNEKLIEILRSISKFQASQARSNLPNPEEPNWMINQALDPTNFDPKNRDFNRPKHVSHGVNPGVDVFLEPQRVVLRRLCLSKLSGEFTVKTDAPKLLTDLQNELTRLRIQNVANNIKPQSIKNFLKNYRAFARSVVKKQPWFTWDDTSIVRIGKEGHSNVFEKQAVDLVLGILSPDFVEPQIAFTSDPQTKHSRKRRRVGRNNVAKFVVETPVRDGMMISGRRRVNVKRTGPPTPGPSPFPGNRNIFESL